MKRLYSTYHLLQGLFLIGLSLLAACVEPDLNTNEENQLLTDEILFSPQLPEDWNSLQPDKQNAPQQNQGLKTIYTTEKRVGMTPDSIQLILRLQIEEGIEPDLSRATLSDSTPASGKQPMHKRGVQTAHSTSKSAYAPALGFNDPMQAPKAVPADWKDYPMGIYAYTLLDAPSDWSYEKIIQEGLLTTTINEFMMDQIANYNKTTTAWTYSPIKYWPHSNKYQLKFFAYHPHQSKVNLTGQPTYLTIDATSKIPQLHYTVPTTIAHQVDLLSALPKNPNVNDRLSGTYNKVVEFPFKHMLSAVKVKLGTLSCSGEVRKFSFTNIYDQGTAPMGATGLVKTGDSKQTYLQDFTSDPLEINDYLNKQIGTTMYLLPQTFRDDAKITMNLGFTKTVKGEVRTTEYPLEYPLNQLSNSHKDWKAGNTYTYTITTPEEVNVKIDDEVIGNVKKNVTITNTGLATVYIRAAIVGNWVRNVDGVDEIITTWNSALDGTFVWGADWDTYWKKGSDGYYYYKCRVPRRGTTTIPLFESYTLTAKAPVVDAELDLIIAVQAILCEDIKESNTSIMPNKAEWPEEIVEWLSINEVP